MSGKSQENEGDEPFEMATGPDGFVSFDSLTDADIQELYQSEAVKDPAFARLVAFVDKAVMNANTSASCELTSDGNGYDERKVPGIVDQVRTNGRGVNRLGADPKAREPRRRGGGGTILVTGGSGFIGRHLVAALIARGHSVRIFDTTAPANLPREVEFVRGSILDRAALRHSLAGIETVYHLAAVAHLWSRDANEFDRVNRSGTETLLSATAEARVRRLVHCSTEAILVPRRGALCAIDEASDTGFADMVGPYTRSKYLAEQAALAAAHAGLPVVIVNPTIPIGAGDHQMTPPTAMLARFLFKPSRLLLDCTLNLVDVRDVADGMVLAAERGRVGERYILGGENVTLHNLAQALAQMSGRTAPKLVIPSTVALAKAAVSEWFAAHVTHRPPATALEGVRLALRSAPFDSSKARRELGYAPRPVQEAVMHAVSWLRSIAPAAREPVAFEAWAQARRAAAGLSRIP